jgi:glycosyltransferase involved in cell wall biosynthesis
MVNVAFVTHETLGGSRAGPGIRALELAAVLASTCEVRLASMLPSSFEDPRVEIVPGHIPRHLQALERWADVVVVQGWVMDRNPWLYRSAKILAADMYDPWQLEQLESNPQLSASQRSWRVTAAVRSINRQLTRCDYFFCATERQRDFWLGHLASLGRLNPFTYEDDPRPSGLVGIVPFGLPTDPPRAHGPFLRRPGGPVSPDDVVVLWWGGVYPWFDPDLAIRAVAALAQSHPTVRLVFSVARHPNPTVAEPVTVPAARRLVRELGIESNVVLLEDWIPYEQRSDILLEADLGLSVAKDHLESRFSFRTRALDYLWAGVPIVCTRGDELGDLVDRSQLGATCRPADLEGLVTSLREMVTDPGRRRACSARVSAAAQDFTWPRVAAPLVEFCSHPNAAKDRDGAGRSHRSLLPEQKPAWWRIQYNAHAFGQAAKTLGLRGAAKRASDQLLRVIGHGVS